MIYWRTICTKYRQLRCIRRHFGHLFRSLSLSRGRARVQYDKCQMWYFCRQWALIYKRLLFSFNDRHTLTLTHTHTTRLQRNGVRDSQTQSETYSKMLALLNQATHSKRLSYFGEINSFRT